MKIALVSPYDFSSPGGVVNHIRALASEYKKLGHDVCILSPTHEKNYSGPDKFLPMGDVKAIPFGGTVVRISISLNLAPRIKDILEKEQFDVIHLHEPFMPMLCSAMLKYSRTVNIGTFHACNGKPGYYWGWPISVKMLKDRNKNLQGHIAVSSAALRYATKFVSGDFSVIPNGVSLERFNPSVKPFEEYRDGKINIVFVGRMEKRKGLHYLLGAYNKLKKENDNIRLIVVGSGKTLRKAYETYVRKENLQDVVFIGEVAFNDLPRWYQTADIFCSPATGEESFGMVLLEAMALGKPIVASANEGYSTVVTNGKEGILVTPKSVDELEAALKKLVDDGDLRQQMGQAGLETVKQYDWPVVAQRILAYYDECIKQNGKEVIKNE
ncbi:MAG: glycosyltransferase family 4 protein [Dehalococcoidales bacterium]|nr:glycosyltransferase family 4 protein [Dehalococcoidales bacterium]